MVTEGMKNQEPNAGWKQADEYNLKRQDPSNDPDIQILTEEDYENEDKEQREYWCANYTHTSVEPPISKVNTEVANITNNNSKRQNK